MRRAAQVAVAPTIDWPADANVVRVRCDMQGVTPDHMVNIAVVERGLSNDVDAGENKGRKLSHDNVVRAFVVINPQQAPEGVSVQVPDDVERDKAEVVVYVQHRINLAIVGAAAVAAKPAEE
jgi:hypothetical protein